MDSTHITAAADHSHADNVAHHFESAQQQFDAGKLGMWLFLVTEVLFFSGLFVTYAVYRSNHPEVFVDAHKYLNTTLGAFNTIVLLVSSLTMAWAVRCAQLGQKRGLVGLLAATISLSSLFLGVKAVEYSHKWGEGLLWAGAYSAESIDHSAVSSQITQALLVLSIPASLLLLVSVTGCVVCRYRQLRSSFQLWLYMAVAAGAFFVGVGIGQGVEYFGSPERSSTHEFAGAHESVDQSQLTTGAPANNSMTGVFFSIYYAMTGVHAIHILAGMGVMVWLLRRSIRGDFGPNYFGPVDFVALYWHLVDLVWIYLFPLLYLIR